MSLNEIQRLIHELQVHQVELENQNQELRRTQLELSIAHDRYLDLYDLAPVGYITLDLKGGVKRANFAAADLLATRRDALESVQLEHFIIFEDREKFVRHICDVVAQGSLQKCEVRLERRDGAKIFVRLETIGDCGDNSAGANEGVRIALVDLTDIAHSTSALRARERQLKVLNDELQQQSSRKDEFLAMLAHELRNPLAAIDAAAKLCKSDDEQRRRWSHEVIDRQVKQLTHLIDDLLDVSRITRGKIHLSPEVIDIRHLIHSALETVRATNLIKGQSLRLELADVPLCVRGDKTRLEQILINIVSNAFKYTPSDGTIWITAARAGDEVEINVKDNGIGIEKQMLTSIFDVFVQADRSLDRSSGGLGLGLTVVDRLVRLHEGRILAESDGPGTGSVFRLFLPLAGDAPDMRNESKTELHSGHKRVLVVEDNLDAGAGLKALLEMEGYDVRLVDDGAKALAIVSDFRPEVIVLDIGLPEMDGYEVARKLRAGSVCSESIIVALSGYGMPEDRERSKAAGFDNHLIKPVDFSELMRVVDGAFSEPLSPQAEHISFLNH